MTPELLAEIEKLLRDAYLGYAAVDRATYVKHVGALLEERGRLLVRLAEAERTVTALELGLEAEGERIEAAYWAAVNGQVDEAVHVLSPDPKERP